MSPGLVRKKCSRCHETLPRAAHFRCPFCRAPILRSTSIAKITCTTCKNPIPNTHAGRCPGCAVANRFKGRKLGVDGRQ
tara:strand:- start:74 stop:310 length:237 start_codon:yes stop_codon:yes gene_type:complete